MGQGKDIMHPPKWANRFLEFYCKTSLIEEIQGDLYELFDIRVEAVGLRRARLLFIWEVFRFFKWSNIKRSKKVEFNNTAMLKNYFKVGFRSLLKNKVPSFINIFGLSLAIGMAIVVFLFLDYQYNMDAYHQNANRIYNLTNYVQKDDGLKEWGRNPIPLKTSIDNELDQVEKSARIEAKRAIIKFDGQVFSERVSFVDPAYLEIFSFPMISGNSRALYKDRNVVISKRIAEKFFGTRDPMGEEIEIIFRNTQKELFTVAGVADKAPANSSMTIDVFLPFHHLKNIYDIDPNDWSQFVDATFVLLKEGASFENTRVLLNEKYVAIQNEAQKDWKISSFSGYVLTELSINNYNIDYSISTGGHPGGRIGLAVIAGLLLLLSCFNYMNIAVVSATNRLKEIGLRKAIGGNRGQIIRQFLTENILVCSISSVLGFVLAYYLLLPGFNSALPIDVPFEFSSNGLMASFFIGQLLLVGLISGAYPAFYISSFDAASIFRGNQKFGKKNFFSKMFLVFQFALAFITILGGVLFTRNSDFQKNLDWGYAEEQVVAVPIEGDKHYTALHNAFIENSDIEMVSGAVQHIGESFERKHLENDFNKLEVASFKVGFGYLETMGVEVVEGRSFDKDIASDKLESIIISAQLAKDMEWDNPVNKEVRLDSGKYYVVGVVPDVRFVSFYDKMIPMVFRIAHDSTFNYIAVNTPAQKTAKTAEFVAATWKTVEPDLPYNGFLQNEVFDYFFIEMEANNKLMHFISAMALILACMGLFGLVSFNISRKMKEYSIRRVLGADLTSITKSVNNDFMWYLIIAGVIGAPVAYFLMHMLLTNIFDVVMPMTIWPFVISLSAVVGTAYLTISSQIVKVSKNNPADTLRSE